MKGTKPKAIIPGINIPTEKMISSDSGITGAQLEFTLTHLAQALNTYLKAKFSSEEDLVVISSLVGQDGLVLTGTLNRVLVQLVELAPAEASAEDEALFDSLTIMISANFNSHIEAVKLIGEAGNYFRMAAGQEVEYPQMLNSPIAAIRPLNLSVTEMAGVMGMLRMPYMPSLCYRIWLKNGLREYFDQKNMFPTPNSLSDKQLVKFIEEKLWNLLKAFVLEPNNEVTWLTAYYSMQEYLRRAWQKGLLSGSRQRDAFKIVVGPGYSRGEPSLSLEMNVIVNIQNKWKEINLELFFM